MPTSFPTADHGNRSRGEDDPPLAPRSSRSFDLFSLGAVRVAVDWSWFVVFSLVTASLASGYLPARHPGYAFLTYWAFAFVMAILFFASILAHELSHAWTSNRHGVRVRRITLFVFGGVSHLESEPLDPATDFRIAMVGPLMSLWLGASFAVLALLLDGGGEVPIEGGALQYLAVVNFALAVFNLLPGLPLDGGRVLRSVLWRRTGDFETATTRASEWGRGIGGGIMALGLLEILIGELLGGVWLLLIGMFIRGAAGGSRNAAAIDRVLRRTCVRDVMVERPVVVQGRALVSDVVDEVFLRHGFGGYPVMDDERVVGLLSLAEVKRCPREEQTRRTVAEVMRPSDEGVRACPSTSLGEALQRMRKFGSTRLLVMEGERLVGLVTQTGILRVLGMAVQLDPVRERARPPSPAPQGGLPPSIEAPHASTSHS